jgi:hypothetical protein
MSPVSLWRSLLFLAALSASTGAWAQSASPWVRSAVLTVCVDDVAEFILNGVPIARAEYTPLEKGQAVVDVTGLCSFRRVNVLAIRLSDTGVTEVGVAYILRVMFSDGRWLVLTSNEENLHRCYWVRDEAAPEPPGWTLPAFDDTRWGKAFNLGAEIPHVPQPEDKPARKRARFMSASGESSRVQQERERHLFRRSFLLDITVRPDCITPSPTPPWVPSPSPAPTFSPTTTRTSTPTRTWTPFRTSTPSRTPTILRRPTKPHPTWTFTRMPVPRTPTAAPTPVVKRPFRTFTPTATARILRTRVVLAALPTFTPTRPPTPATSTPTVWPARPEILKMRVEERLTFEKPPLSFFVSFPETGDYRIEVYDGAGALVRVIFDERVRSHREQWVEWDGRDASGARRSPGEYEVLYFRDGRPVRRITAVLQSP